MKAVKSPQILYLGSQIILLDSELVPNVFICFSCVLAKPALLLIFKTFKKNSKWEPAYIFGFLHEVVHNLQLSLVLSPVVQAADAEHLQELESIYSQQCFQTVSLLNKTCIKTR